MSNDNQATTPRVKPTMAQVRGIWDAMPDPSLRKVHAKVIANGGNISLSTIQRWENKGWVDPPRKKPGRKTNAELGITKAESFPVQTARVADADADAQERDLNEVRAFAKPELDKAADVKTRRDLEFVIYQILILRAGQRRPNLLSLMPQHVAALVQAMAQPTKLPAAAPIEAPAEPAPASNGVKHEPNEAASAIKLFRREHGLSPV